MFRFVRWTTAVLALSAATGLQAAQRDGIDVQLSTPTPVLRGDVDVVVAVTVTNTARHPVTLVRWQLPSDELEGALFRITRDDQPVRYLGPVVKRAQPDASDHVKLEPGATLSYQVELTSAYDLSQSGRYAIQYLGRGQHGNAATLSSAPLYLWLEGRSGKAATAPAAPVGSAASIGYTGNCSATQQSTLQTAVGAATNYATSSSSYLSRTPAATQRYVKWFGAYSQNGWNTAKAHFAAISDAFVNKPLTLDCKCKKRNVYAYVYPTEPYKIYLCGAFWAAPMTGTDSKGGTLIHEMSHFDVVAGTEDWAYGQSAAAALAVSDPAKALDNADSHEYFAENTPPLP
ncbi:M35 family metallo-endopeptidase [Piscinibacter sp. XHJ-5]|uniref:M35 family metallo-endopeptidase n=1 Tax=Piscinibacter sp. XHJ-5 TaxID=3037797 RepID=UPI0024528537|nr:M35 family metallo-endopeptidase [Piscinibacter sp. XHJ-5]